MFENLAIFSGFVFLYSLLCGRLEKTPINGALVFALFGVVVGPLGLDLLHLDVNAESISILAELTLALVLFSDAANSNLRILQESIKIPGQLLGIGLPLTILLGLGVGLLLFNDLLFFEVAIIATMLAPTDAALGKAVVTNKSVPSKIREGLNVESGLNDGICVPILYLFLALALKQQHHELPGSLALKLVAEEIGIGLLVGLGLTAVAVWLFNYFSKRKWVTETWQQLPVVALALACYSVAYLLGGSGFIACFSGGLLFNRIEHHHKRKLLLAAEGTGDILALITWVLFGAVVIGQSVGAFNWQIVLYSVLSLTVVRMLPVFLSLTGTGLRSREKWFIGWFGPRGLASIVFAVIVLNQKLPHAHTISMTVVCTILLSVVLHGLSANHFVRVLSTRIQATP